MKKKLFNEFKTFLMRKLPNITSVEQIHTKNHPKLKITTIDNKTIYYTSCCTPRRSKYYFNNIVSDIKGELNGNRTKNWSD